MAQATIRRAVEADCPRLLELIRGLAVYERMPEEVTITPEELANGGFGATPLWWAFVAETEGRIVGFALYFIRFSTWKGKQMHLEDIYIEPEMRRMGIGKLLFERLVAEGRERNFSAIKWQALEWNEPALNFYRNCFGAKLDDQWIDCSIELR